MIKGVNKSVVEVANMSNRYFERAILFVKPEYSSKNEDFLRAQAKKYVETVNIPGDFICVKKQNKKRITFKQMIAAIIAVSAALTVYLLLR